MIRILQNAHAGELAAAYAYRGHWKSVNNEEQRARIKKIEEEEWDHRQRVKAWLETLDASPRVFRERVFWTIGKSLGLFCSISGWFFPMYFAGRLESQNTREYKDAAAFAQHLKLEECESDLLEMSEKELDHEEYFRSVIADHWLLVPAKIIFRWS